MKNERNANNALANTARLRTLDAIHDRDPLEDTQRMTAQDQDYRYFEAVNLRLGLRP
jgi:hypothetical protein